MRNYFKAIFLEATFEGEGLLWAKIKQKGLLLSFSFLTLLVELVGSASTQFGDTKQGKLKLYKIS